MFTTVTICDPPDFLALVAGLVLLLKKVAEMDRYQPLWTVVFTTALGSLVIYFFLLYMLGPMAPLSCVAESLCTP